VARGPRLAKACLVANTSLVHEAPLEVLRESPDVVVDLLALLGHPLRPAPYFAYEADPDTSEVVPAHRSADFVAIVRHGDEQHIAAVVIVEVQRQIDRDKGYAWAQYVAGLAAAHRAPVELLVWTFDERVASWARGAFPLGGSMRLSPLVLGPTELVRMRKIAEAHDDTELMMLAALTRLGGSQRPAATVEREVMKAARAVVGLRDPARRKLYASLLHGTAKGRIRAILEEFLEVHGMGALELIRREGWEEGRQEGRQEGRSEVLLRLLRRRGFTVDAALEQRVSATRDEEQLGRWLDRVLDARSLDAVFDEP